MSADPITEAPGSSQGWNRYAYVGNSPVNFTDPSGYCFMGCGGKGLFGGLGRLLRKFPIIGSIIKIAASAICVATLGPGCAPIAAFLSSAFVTGVSGGSLGQALKSGLIAAATAVAFNVAGDITGGLEGGKALASGNFGAGFGTPAHIFKIASHAGIGCLSAMASGGKCGAGALSAGVSAGATPFYSTGSMAGNTAVAAVVGGVASKLGGGSFADGAATAAFGYLFNAEMGRRIGQLLGGLGGGALGFLLEGPAGIVPTGARSALVVGEFLSKLEDRTIAAGQTTGFLISGDGDVMVFASGSADPRYKNYFSATHAEGKAAIYMRDNGMMSGVLFHNNRHGTCDAYCNKQLNTLLPPGAVLWVVPTGVTQPKNGYNPKPAVYVGNPATPRVPR